MRENRAKVIAWIGLSEGGYVNNPKDPGGPTNRGITQRTYTAWLKVKGRPKVSVRQITKAEADEIIGDQYLTPVRFDDLPDGLDYSVGDYSVNSGPSWAAKELQRCLGVTPDGTIGTVTLGAIAAADLEKLIVDYNNARMRFLRGLKTFDEFGRGWTSRVHGRVAGAQVDDIGVLDRSVLLARGRAQIAAPVVVAPGKAREEDVKSITLMSKVTEDPVALIPIVGTFLAQVSGMTGPIAWAMAGIAVAGALYWAVRSMRRAV